MPITAPCVTGAERSSVRRERLFRRVGGAERAGEGRVGSLERAGEGRGGAERPEEGRGRWRWAWRGRLKWSGAA